MSATYMGCNFYCSVYGLHLIKLRKNNMDKQSEDRLCEVISSLARAWRADWSHFDGRTLRDQLSKVKQLIRQDEEITEKQVEKTVQELGICLECKRWTSSYRSWCCECNEEE